MTASIWFPGSPISVLDRILRVPIGEQVTDVPALAERALKTLAFDALGNPIALAPIPGPRGPTGPKGNKGDTGAKGDPGNYLGFDLIGASTDIADRPVSASDGEAWGLLVDDTIRVYIWFDGAWYDAGTITSSVSVPAAGIFYVTKGGSDSNSGLSLDNPLLTINAAVDAAIALGTPCAISVYPGEYEEAAEISVPDNCAIVGALGQFLTKVVPTSGDEQKNMFLVGSGCYIQGFSFSGMQIDDFDDPTGGFAVAFRPDALIIRSPYIRDISQISNYPATQIAPANDVADANPSVGVGGGVLLADRSVLDPNSIFPYMLAFGATPRSPNGMGYVAKNGAGINGISSISIFQRYGFYALNGGQITLNNSGTQFGDYSMYAKGSMDVVIPSVSTESLLESGAAGTLLEDNSADIVDTVWSDLVSNGYTAGWPAEAETFTRRDAANLIQAIAFDMFSGTQTSTQAFGMGLYTYDATPVFNVSYKTAFLASFGYLHTAIETYVTDTAQRTAISGLIDLVTEMVDTPNIAQFGSLIESLGHQFNNAGAGVNVNALPTNFRRPGTNRDVTFTVLQDTGGRVRWSGADEKNNQYFAGGTRINGLTGKLEGRPFTASVRQIARRISNSRGFF